MSGVEGFVYLIHLERPIHHASHYIGWTEKDVQKRLERHRSGDGARLLRAAKLLGIEFDVVRVWPGTRELERKLKKRKGARRLCPTCLATKQTETV